jgi:leucyl/phenylalanyl-tRNA--protein transferase
MKSTHQHGPFFLPVNDPNHAFPDPKLAMDEPNGLLAVGGDLSAQRLINAYRHGIFPWYNAGQPILWWSPNPRAVIFPDLFETSRSLKKTINKGHYTVTYDRAFADVIHACAQPRHGVDGTWISDEMATAYNLLHTMGVAHSLECWANDRLAGGLYGIALGRVFFGESMFYRDRDASKVAFAYLVQRLRQWGYALIDCQISSAHVASLGAIDIPRGEFLDLLRRWSTTRDPDGAWQPSDMGNP